MKIWVFFSLLGNLIANDVSAGTVEGNIDGHAFSIEASCEVLSNGWIKVRSMDPGFSQSDTNGDGYFFEASGPGQLLATVFHFGAFEYKAGFSDVDISTSGFSASDTMQRHDGTEYQADINVIC